MAVNKDVHNYDVKVINAYKCYYGGVNIINGLNMNVKSGSIYGLLGPSGCGKSTLIQCILGVFPLDSGCIKLEIRSQCDIGYMPQDLCLDGKLTVEETFEYYGILYKMNERNIKNRMVELKNILKLPNFNRFIEDLSGGESRRISLAITLLHDPKIMIMDEPTVGIDSMLRHEIWDEFKRITEQQKKTIIITTHYIEEANQADYVGLMRNGVLLEEGPPVDILLKYNTGTLESAFLTICCKEEDNNMVHMPAFNTVVTDNNGWKKPRKSPKKIIDYSRIKGLLKKNMRLFSRDYMLMFTTLVFPILQTALICACIGNNTKDLKIAIKNDEVNFSECRYYNNNNGCVLENKSNQTLSCVIINRLVSLGYVLNEVKDRNVGESIIKKPKYIAFIHFPKNYTSEFAKYIDDQDNYDLQLQPYMDLNNHNTFFKNAMLADIMETMKYLVQSVLHDCSNNPKALDVPLKFITVTGKEVKSYINSIVSIYIAM
ncbi:Hypothetical protein CINCED_3A004789 [Cinara cedri]|nr:Hypothetical protein CINCED_3A004789 [Cinara cedri]